MIQSIKDILKDYNIDGDIILYRDPDHKKKKMCEYVIAHTELDDRDICTFSDGAFALYLARAIPEKTVHAYYYIISSDYGELMEAQSNLVLHPGFFKQDYYKVVESNDYINIYQYDNPYVSEYYKNHFPDIVDAVKNYQIDAFCDCCHSRATLGGFLKANHENKLVDWEFICGIRDLFDNYNQERPVFYNSGVFLDDYEKEINYANYLKFDTYELGNKIEAEFPDFGNVYEATRSIASAMSWLLENPSKTVLVYVGDNYIKEGTQFR